MWAELSRHGITNRLLMACHNIATNPRNHAAEMHVIDDRETAYTRDVLIEQCPHGLPRAGFADPFAGSA